MNRLIRLRSKIASKVQSSSAMTRLALGFVLFIVELVILFYKIPHLIFLPESESYQRFAEKDENGSFVTSYTSHQKMRKTSIRSIGVVALMSIVYIASGIFVPNKVAVIASADYTVNDASDTGNGVCNDGSCTLRDAIIESNSGSGNETIGIDAALDGQTIYPTSPLPALTVGGTHIDGDIDADGIPNIGIDGSMAGVANGFAITSDGNIIQGFSIGGFSQSGIVIIGAQSNTIFSNYVGTNIAGDTASANQIGINLLGSPSNFIGGTNAGEGNLISGNTTFGMYITGAGSTGNSIRGNIIGANALGEDAVPNAIGIGLVDQASSNTLGGNNIGLTCSGVCNLLSGNTINNVAITNATDNQLAGNYIGLNLSGTRPLQWNVPDNHIAVSIAGNALRNTIGGDRSGDAALGYGNILSGIHGTGAYAVVMTANTDSEENANTVFGNILGLSPAGGEQDNYNNSTGDVEADGIHDFVNSSGILLNISGGNDPQYTQVGDGTAEHRNVLSASGIALAVLDTQNVVVNGNYFGTDISGEERIAGSETPFHAGILVSGSVNNSAGTIVLGNTISGHLDTNYDPTDFNTWNLGVGIFLGSGINGETNFADNITILANKIGTDKDGESAIGNNFGILCNQASNITIGGVDEIDGNIISGNGYADFGGPISTYVFGDTGGCHDITVQNNLIGTNISGESVLGNEHSIELGKGANNLVFDQNTIVGSTSDAIAGNDINDTTFSQNVFGADSDGLIAMENTGAALRLASSYNIIFEENTVLGGSGGVVLGGNHDVTIQDNQFGIQDLDAQISGNPIDIANGFHYVVNDNAVLAAGGQDAPFYAISQSPLQYDEKVYDDIFPEYVCPEGSTATTNIVKNTGLLLDGPICRSGQIFFGLDGSESEVETYLVSTETEGYTIFIARDEASFLTCEVVANIVTGTCDLEFTAFVNNGQDFAFSSFPDGVTVVDGYTTPPQIETIDLVSAGIRIAGVPGDETVVSGNTITAMSGDGAQIYESSQIGFRENALTSNTRNGLSIQGLYSQNNQINLNQIESNLKYGIESQITHTTDENLTTGDNLFTDNTIQLNVESGILNIGSSPLIQGNVIADNEGNGIENHVEFGSSAHPDTASDDTLSRPTIGSNASPNTIQGNAKYGIYGLDTGPDNASDLEVENIFDETNVLGRVFQEWYGMVLIQDESLDPVDGASVVITGANGSSALFTLESNDSGFAPDSAMYGDSTTWQKVPEYIIGSTGEATSYSPQELFAEKEKTGQATFSFDGSEKEGESSLGNIGGRYQIATIVLNQDVETAAVAESETSSSVPTSGSTRESAPNVNDLAQSETTEVANNLDEEKEGNNVTNNVATGAAAAATIISAFAATTPITGASLLRLFMNLFSEPFLLLFGVKKVPWGQLINSVNNKPIELGMVRLYEANSGVLIGTTVTDKTGRFKFVPKPGKYVVKARHDQYTFPSKILSRAIPPIGKNYYFGETIHIKEDKQVFDKYLPMDPMGSKNALVKNIAKKRLMFILQYMVAFGGLAIALINIVTDLSWLSVVLFATHLLLLIFFWKLASKKMPRYWGKVYDVETKKPIASAIVRIYDEQHGELLDTTVTDKKGRYSFLIDEGTYFITVDAREYNFPISQEKASTHDYSGGSVKITNKKHHLKLNIPLEK